MSAWGDLVKGIRETIALNDRATALTAEVRAMNDRQREQGERPVRVGTFCNLARPVVPARLALPAGQSDRYAARSQSVSSSRFSVC